MNNFCYIFLEHSFLFITKTYKHCKYQDKEECTIEGKCEVTGYRLNQTDITILQVNSIQILEEKKPKIWKIIIQQKRA